MNYAMAVGAKNGEVLYLRSRCLPGLSQWNKMMDFAVLRGTLAISLAERETAGLAAE